MFILLVIDFICGGEAHNSDINFYEYRNFNLKTKNPADYQQDSVYH
jgi:hypothetical protein